MRFLPVAALALALGGCSGGTFTQQQVDEMVAKAGDTAYAKAKAEAEARLVKVFESLGKTPEESAALAKEEAAKIGEAARIAAEDLTRKALEPLKKKEGETALGKILTIVGTIGLNMLMGVAQAKTKGA